MRLAHRQHHALVQAMERGQGFRAQALCEEHVEIARTNLEFALERPDVVAEVLPGIALVDAVGRSGRLRRTAEPVGSSQLDKPAAPGTLKSQPSP
jgi:GntR family transcriptional regulator of vanillate catabolism